MSTFRNIHFVVNPAAGKPEPLLHTINGVLHPYDLEWDIRLTRQDGDGQRLARQSIADGADLIVAYGGDGTVKDVANGMLDSNIPLALLHGGTGNAMAFELGIPKSLKSAIELIVNPHELRSIDVGQVMCQEDPDKVGYFLLRMSMGLQTKILETASRELKTKYGNLAYLMASFQEFRSSQKSTYQLTIDGQDTELDGFTVLIANSAYVGGQANFSFAPTVKPDDGLLDIIVFDDDIDDAIQMISNALQIGQDASPIQSQGKEIVINSPEGQLITLDGEIFGHSPATVKILRKAVQVVVPSS